MLRKRKKKKIKSVLHLDDTARVQTISDKDGDLFTVLSLFEQETGIPILCNTSLNDNGEPIIDDINQAINFALRKNIDIIYYEGKRVRIHNHDLYDEKEPLKRNDYWFTKYSHDEDIVSKVNPYGVRQEDYYLFRTREDLKELDEKHDRC